MQARKAWKVAAVTGWLMFALACAVLVMSAIERNNNAKRLEEGRQRLERVRQIAGE